LISLQFAQAGESAEDIVAQTARVSENTNVQRYLEEIRRLILDKQLPEDVDRRPLRAGCMELRPDATIAYHGETEKNLIHGLMLDPKVIYEEAVRLFSTR
jgi:hypothetical protein